MRLRLHASWREAAALAAPSLWGFLHSTCDFASSVTLWSSTAASIQWTSSFDTASSRCLCPRVGELAHLRAALLESARRGGESCGSDGRGAEGAELTRQGQTAGRKIDRAEAQSTDDGWHRPRHPLLLLLLLLLTLERRFHLPLLCCCCCCCFG